MPLGPELRRYRPGTARGDVVAGLTVAALALPSAMAYAELAGVSPVNGLYTLLLPAVLYAIFGTSKALVIGPEGSLSTLIGAAVLGMAVAGSPEANAAASMLALLVAGCFLVAWLLRLGWVADYLSRPVLIGYIHGVAVVMIVAQLPKLLGLDIQGSNTFPRLWEIFRELGDVSLLTLAVGVTAIAFVLVVRRFLPRFPAPLAVVVGGMLLSWAADLQVHGVAVIGAIPSGLPSLGVPDVSLLDTAHLLPAAVGVFVLSFADEILTARSFAGRRNQHVRASQELLAMAAANTSAAFSQGFSVGASGSRTSVNDSMGARTQVSCIVAALTVVVILLFFTNPLSYLPKPVLAAVIVAAGLALIDPGAWRALEATDRVEVAIAGVTAGSVILVGVLEAIVFAAGLSIVDVVRRSARPHDAVLGWSDKLGRYADVSVHRSARVTPGVLIYRLDDRIFFANARYVKGRVNEALQGAPHTVRWLVFDAEAVTHVDSTGLAALEELVRACRDQKIGFAVARLKHVPKESFDDSGLTDLIGRENFHWTVRAAVDAFTRVNRDTGEGAPPGPAAQPST